MGFIRRPGSFPGDTLDEQNNFFTIDPRSSFVTADLSLLQAPSPGPVVSDVVFIDSSVPDIQDLLNGLKPGEKAFVIDAGSDGLDQIAGILKSEHLTNLSGIQIVAHGAAGELELGSTTLNDCDLSDRSDKSQSLSVVEPSSSSPAAPCATIWMPLRFVRCSDLRIPAI